MCIVALCKVTAKSPLSGGETHVRGTCVHVLDHTLFAVLDPLTVWCCSYFAQIGDSLSEFDFPARPQP